MGETVTALAVAAVNPVPWARAQMAFTLAFHIILVPLGVSWAFMTLIANYRAIERDDRDALVLAQRWSKYMAVTFAVGAVTGTVLSFEFGLLWPRFMGAVGRGVRRPVRVRGAVLLHRGDLRRDLHLRLAPAETVGALLDRRADRHRRRLRLDLGGRGERVDERAGRLHAELERQGRRRSTRSR